MTTEVKMLVDLTNLPNEFIQRVSLENLVKNSQYWIHNNRGKVSDLELDIRNHVEDNQDNPNESYLNKKFESVDFYNNSIDEWRKAEAYYKAQLKEYFPDSELLKVNKNTKASQDILKRAQALCK